MLHACCFYPGIVGRILDDYQQVVAEEKRLSEVMVGFMDIEEGIPPPAMAQKKEKEEKGETDEEEHTGPDPVEVKKRFSAIKRQFNKTEKSCEKSRKSKVALADQDKLGETFKFIKLSPTQFEKIANPARDSLEIIRDVEKFIYTVMVKRGRMPRKDFMAGYLGNESNREWLVMRLADAESMAKPMFSCCRATCFSVIAGTAIHSGEAHISTSGYSPLILSSRRSNNMISAFINSL